MTGRTREAGVAAEVRFLDAQPAAVRLGSVADTLVRRTSVPVPVVR